MAWHETWLHTDLAKPINVEPLRGVMFSQDNMANKVGVKVTYNGEAAELIGSVIASVIRDDGGTVTWNGYKEGNEAFVVLPEAAYAVVGRISIVIRLINSENQSKTTLAACTAYVYRTSTDTYIDPGRVVPDLLDLLAQIDSMRTATYAANSAAVNANSAAIRIDNIQPTMEVEQIEGDHYKIVVQNKSVSPGVTRQRKIILVGDSYGEGFYVGGATYNTAWPWLLSQNVAGDDIACYFAVHGGFAFGHSDQTKRFENIFEPEIGVAPFDANGQVITDSQGLPDYTAFTLPQGVAGTDITDVYVFAGRNDFLFQGADILTGISGFVAKCSAKFPNAKVYIGMIGGISRNGYQNDDGRGLHYNSAMNNEGKRTNTVETYSQCPSVGAIYIQNCDAILRDTQCMAVDGVHPNQTGQNLLGMYLANAVRGEGVSISRLRSYAAVCEDTAISPAYDSGWTIYSNEPNYALYVAQTQRNQNVSIYTLDPVTLIREAPGIDIALGNYGKIKLFRPSDTCFSGDAYIRAASPTVVTLYDNNGNAHVCRANIEFFDGWVQLNVEGLKMDGTYESNPIASVIRIYLPSIMLNM